MGDLPSALSDRRKSNPWFGLLLGLLTACGLTVLAAGLFVLDGPERFGDISLVGAIATYFLAGALGGPLLGLALPLTVRRGGAVVVGMAVGLAIYFPVSRLVPSLATGAIGAVLVGGIVGFAVWTPPRPDPGDRTHE